MNEMTMTRKEVLELFGGSVDECCKTLGITQHAYYKWDRDRVPDRIAYRLFYLVKTKQLKLPGE